MANRMQDNEELRRAAERSSALLGARNAARRSERPETQPAREEARSGRPEARSTRGEARSARSKEMRSGTTRARSGRAMRSERRPEPDQPRHGQLSMLDFVKQNSSYILSVVGVVLIATLLIVFVRACAPLGKTVTDGVDGGYVCPYDWGKLKTSNGRVSYVVNGQTKSKAGIDVSENQHTIDWAAVASDGIDFAMIRLGYRGSTEGDLYVDPTYQVNLSGAQAAGIKRGVYFFSQARSVDEAVEEAEFVIKNLNGAKLDYPVAFDSEVQTSPDGQSRTASLSTDEMTAIAEAFCNRIERAGYKSCVYGNYYDMSRYSYSKMQQRSLWWAEYGAAEPSAQIDIVMWQYSNSGNVSGIDAAVDMNIDLSSVL